MTSLNLTIEQQIEAVQLLVMAANSIEGLRGRHAKTSVEIEIEEFLESLEPDQNDEDPFS